MIPVVMLVEDSRADQRLCEIIMQRSGIVGEILCFSYAEDALEHLRRPDRKPVDVILLDINMPRMSGFEFLDAATEEFGDGMAKMVVVMLTTSLAPQDVERSKRFQVVKHYFGKPLTEEHLHRIANTLRTNQPVVP